MLAVALAQPLPSPLDRPFEAPSVKLLSAGKAPLKKVRYALGPAQEVTIVASGEWRMSNAAASSSTPFPVMSTPVRLTPAKGLVDYKWLKASFTGAPAGTRLEEMTRQLLEGLEGSGGVYSADGQGAISRFLLHPGGNDPYVDAGTLQQRSLYALQMGRALIALVDVPLPAEDIGIGAKWQVERIAVRGTMSFVQVTTFTLDKLEAKKLQLSYTFSSKFDPGCGLREEELVLGVGGGGKATVDLGLPLPIALEDEITVNAEIRGRQGQRASQAGTVRTRVQPK
jgi:hypothetical protein